MNIQRIGDSSYFIKNNNEKFIVQISKSIGSPEECYNFLKNHLSALKEQNESAKLNSKQWKLVPVINKPSLAHKIGSAIIKNFFFPPPEEGIKQFRLENSKSSFCTPPEKNYSESMLKKEPKLTSTEIHSGMKSKATFNSSKEGTKAPFTDPYTKLATHAFQKIEMNFTNKDKHLDPKENLTCLVFNGKEVVLKQQNYTPPITKQEHQQTVKHYHDYLVNIYGNDKVDYIEHLYGIDFKAMHEEGSPLTPEYVYRMNIGMTNIETSDLEQASKRLNIFISTIGLDPNMFLLDPNMSLNDALNTPSAKEILLGNDVRCLLRRFQEEKIEQTLGNFKEWIVKNGLNQPFNQMTSAQVGELMKVYAIRPEDREGALTGKKIFESMLGWYNSYELAKYKPWLDQQQLIQAFAEYEGTKDPQAFYEMLSFVIVKFHLAREHPSEGYKVGALIPAPLDDKGNQRWYKVSSFVSNGYGLFSYTLEGVGKESGLPAIKLYRSTSSSPCCMHGESSVRNDMNPLNSPGYEGTGMGDKYEKDFFDERSIPVWVGYLSIAQQNLNSIKKPLEKTSLESAFQKLKQANEEIKQDTIRPFRRKDFKDIIRNHDAILNDLVITNESIIGTLAVKSKPIQGFIRLMTEFQDQYIRNEGINKKSGEIKNDAAKLIMALRDFFKIPGLKPHQKDAMQNLVAELLIHVTGDPSILEQEQKRALKNFDNHFEPIAEEYLKNNQLDKAHAVMKQWALTLEKIAREKGELPEQKKQDPLVVTGHSLGGASTQSQSCHFLFSRGRIPVKSLELYCFDDPGINKKENEQFKAFGNKHSDLLKSMDVKISINRFHETGDPTPLGGEEHLGSVFSQKEQKKVSLWLNYHGTVLKKRKTAKAPSIRESATSHATRFRLGIGLEKKRIATINDKVEEIILHSKTSPKKITVSVQKEEKTDKVGKDYIETIISNTIQGKVDRGEIELNNLWKISPFKPVHTEKLRSSYKLFLAKAFITKPNLHPQGEKYFDKKGVLAVNETGVVSSKN